MYSFIANILQICMIYMLCTGQSHDCAANPWFVPQTMDPGFAQDNPRIEGNGGVKGREQGIGDIVDKHYS